MDFFLAAIIIFAVIIVIVLWCIRKSNTSKEYQNNIDKILSSDGIDPLWIEAIKKEQIEKAKNEYGDDSKLIEKAVDHYQNHPLVIEITRNFSLFCLGSAKKLPLSSRPYIKSTSMKIYLISNDYGIYRKLKKDVFSTDGDKVDNKSYIKEYSHIYYNYKENFTEPLKYPDRLGFILAVLRKVEIILRYNLANELKNPRFRLSISTADSARTSKGYGIIKFSVDRCPPPLKKL